MKKRGHAKSAVMQTKYRMKVERDKTKYSKKQKHKGRTSDLCSIIPCVFRKKSPDISEGMNF